MVLVVVFLITVLTAVNFFSTAKLTFPAFNKASAQTGGTTYYISPDGNDANSGTSDSSPWKTFVRAWSNTSPSVQAGDTLVLMDGIYYQSLLPKRAGQNGNPITIRAQHDGKAIIDGQYQRIPVQLGTWEGDPYKDYFIIEGIVARNSSGSVFQVQGNYNILRRISGYNANRDGNNHVVSLGYQTHGNLVEDCIAAGSGRKMAFAYAADRSTIRRCFVYWQRWDGRDWHDYYPWGDGQEMYNSSNGIIENGIAYGAYTSVAFNILSNVSTTMIPKGANNNKILGSMAIRNSVFKDGTIWRWPLTRPQPTVGNTIAKYWEWPPARRQFGISTWGSTALVSDTLFQDIFAWGGAQWGFGISGNSSDLSNNVSNALINRATIINNGLDAPSVSGGIGTDARIDYLDLVNTTNSKVGIGYDPVTTKQVQNPFTGEGARLQHRYVDGVLKDGSDGTPAQPLWPWGMQDRLIKEMGIDITGEMTDLLIDQEIPTGKTIKAPVISPVPPEGAPLQNVSGVTYLSPITVTITHNTPGITIRYTLDESEPTTNSPTYNGPITLDQTTLVKTKAFLLNGEESHLRSAYFIINPSVSNQPPEITADLEPFIHPYIETVLPNNTVKLYATVSDLTLPSGTSQAISTWTQVSGPSQATITDPSKPRTSAIFPESGLYVLKLTVTDGELSTSKEVRVQVWPNDLQGIVHTIPGRIEAENYKSGGEGVGYHQTYSYSDTLYRNQTGPYNQPSKVDATYAYNDYWGYAIRYINQEEWYAYDVNIQTPGIYTLNFRYSADATGSAVHLSLDGQDISGSILIDQVRTTRQYFTKTVTTPPLSAGRHELRLHADAAPEGWRNNNLGNLTVNYFEFIPTDTDLDESGSVGINDALELFRNWFTPVTNFKADIDRNSKVNGLDFSYLKRDWSR